MVVEIKTLLYLGKVIKLLLKMSVFRKLLPDKVAVRLRAKCFLRVRNMPRTSETMQLTMVEHGPKLLPVERFF